jgi:hypothetical protein
VTAWATIDEPPDSVRARTFAPSALMWDGGRTRYLLEGDERDVDVQLAAVGGDPAEPYELLPEGAHRGRISVRPGALVELSRALDAITDCAWVAEGGVGTVHVATDSLPALVAARAAAHVQGGWLLREAGGGDNFDGFGRALPDLDIARRLKAAFDPSGKLSPGRLPL